MSFTRPRRLTIAVATVGLTATLVVPSAAQSDPDPLPIVFVHGQSGSASQFATQFTRFTSNGYPQELLFAYEYDTNVDQEDGGEAIDAGLDDFVDDVLTTTGADEVHLVGHSRGTQVSIEYLDDLYGTDTDRADKVASYVSIDGRDPDELPGGVPTLGVWGEWNSGGDFSQRGDELAQIGPDGTPNVHFPDKGHSEVVSAAESFPVIHEFLTGEEPATTDVVPERPDSVTVAGRATLFPANVGYEGSTLELWRVDPDTGQRVGTRPRATTELDATGDFGPWAVNGGQHYAFALVRPDGSVHHFHRQPFHRSDHFVRLQSGVPGEGIEGFVPKSDDHVTLTTSRQREFWGDQGDGSDVLEVDGVDVAAPQIAPRAAVNLAIFAHDVGTDQQTDLDAGVPPPFDALPFLTAADVFLPASPDADGTIEVAHEPRDGDGERSVVPVPNWPSTDHRVSVDLRDHVQDAYAWAATPGTVTPCPDAYPDLPSDFEHTPAICVLTDSALAQGRDGGGFDPQGSVTRGQVATLVAGALDLPAADTSGFPDVPDEFVHAGAIGALVEAGIVSGYDDGRFGASDPVTRGQMATIIVEALGVDASGHQRFPDVPDGYVHAGAISALADRDVIVGRNDGTYGPQSSITRGQSASIVVRAFALTTG